MMYYIGPDVTIQSDSMAKRTPETAGERDAPNNIPSLSWMTAHRRVISRSVENSSHPHPPPPLPGVLFRTLANAVCLDNKGRSVGGWDQTASEYLAVPLRPAYDTTRRRSALAPLRYYIHTRCSATKSEEDKPDDA